MLWSKSPTDQSRRDPVIDVYRTNDGTTYFKFKFVPRSGGKWRVDIEDQPSYGARDSGLHSSHRLSSSTATTGFKICFANEPTSLREARKYAETWAEGTHNWIKTGQRTHGF